MNHSTGPWNLRADPDDAEAWIIVDSTHAYFRVCDVSPRFEAKEELHNARLIAAAPELLRLLTSINDFGYDRGMPIARHVRELLASTVTGTKS